MNVYHSVSREQVEIYLYKLTYDLLIGVIDEKSQGKSIREEDKKFIADFYKYAFVSLMLDWIRSDMKDNPKTIVDRLALLIQGNITTAIQDFASDSI